MKIADLIETSVRIPALRTCVVAHSHWTQLHDDVERVTLYENREALPSDRMSFYGPHGLIHVALSSHLPPGVRIDLDKDLCVIEPNGDLTRCDEHPLWPLIQIALKLPKGKMFRASTCTHCGAPGQALVCEYCGVSR